MDSKDRQEVLARPARTIQVASALSVAELEELMLEMTTLVSASSWRRAWEVQQGAVVVCREIREPGVSEAGLVEPPL